jgi:hypothetical protein
MSPITIEALAGINRQIPAAIFQAPEILERIADGLEKHGHGYDLDAPGFIDYLQARGVAHHIGREGTTWRTWCAAPAGRTLAEFREQEEFRVWKEDPPEGGRGQYLPHEQEFHWKRWRRAVAAIADCWELFSAQAGDHSADSRQPDPEPSSRAQRLLDEALGYGVEFERQGESINLISGTIPRDKYKRWKAEFNEVYPEFALLLPDTKSLMQQPEGFVEISPGNFVHEDDLPSVRAMIAITEPVPEPEIKQAQPEPKPTDTQRIGPQPNENGVFLKQDCDIPWSYRDKETDVAILIIEWKGAFFQSFEIHSNDFASCGLPNINHKSYESATEAQKVAADTLLKHADRPGNERLKNIFVSLRAFIESLSKNNEIKTEPIPQEITKKARKKREDKPAKPGPVQVDLFGFEDAA